MPAGNSSTLDPSSDTDRRAATSKRVIEVRGVHFRNLRGLDVDIPLHALVVLVGVSGSGKSSLAFDVLCAEARRRYLEFLAPTWRAARSHGGSADVDHLAPLPPAVAVAQPETPLPQETVMTAVEADHPLRLLFQRFGTCQCERCGVPLAALSPGQAADWVRALPAGTRVQIAVEESSELSPDRREQLVQRGWTKAIVNGISIELRDAAAPAAPVGRTPTSAPNASLIVIDRVKSESPVGRLRDSLEQAYREGNGGCVLLWSNSSAPAGRVHPIDGQPWSERRVSSSPTCPLCDARQAAWDARCFRGEATAEPTSRETPFRWIDRSFDDFRRATASQLMACGELSSVRLTSPAQRILAQELEARLQSLCELGLGDIPLHRPVEQLSFGEQRRLRLAGALSQSLSHSLYIFDEPTAGVTPEWRPAIWRRLRALVEQGNSVVAVEHDRELARQADWIIEMGPGAGAWGGRIVYEGPPGEWTTSPSFGEWLHTPPSESTAVIQRIASRIHAEDAAPTRKRTTAKSGSSKRPARASTFIQLTHGRYGVLNDVDLVIPTPSLCLINGPSGSGKTTLLMEILRPLLVAASSGPSAASDRGELTIQGPLPLVDVVDASPLGAARRSTVATVLKVFDDVRELFAESADARSRGWTAALFGHNAAHSGRCPECRGSGELTFDLKVGAEISSVCPECGGSRYRRELLEAKYRGLSIADVLKLTLGEAMAVFRTHYRIPLRLEFLRDAGLDYLVLGQPARSLSGGEAQRVKLASRLSRPLNQPGIVLCDQPARGLPPVDAARLASTLRKLVEAGHTVLAIDHNPLLLAAADCVVDLSP